VAETAFTSEHARKFLAATRDAGADPRVTQAIAAAKESPATPLRAIDLGCGPGHEAVAILLAGFDLVALDAFPEMVEATRARAERFGVADRLRTLAARIEDAPPEPARYGLVHARFALPFVPEARFPAVWAAIRAALVPGGVFAGQLFGPHDEFLVDGERPRSAMNAHDTAAVDRLVAGLEILHREEVERDGVTALGTPKHWHVHHLIVRRPADG